MSPGADHIEWLVSNGMTDLEDPQILGPEEDRLDEEEVEWWRVDWDGFLSGTDREFEEWLDAGTVEEILNGQMTDESAEQIARGPDVCAWYSSMHHHAADWGITIRNDCIVRRAKEFAYFLAGGAGSRVRGAHQLAQAAFDFFFQHELFHHKVESLAIRLEVIEQRPVYVPYVRSVYRSAFGTDDCLEEGLANAHAYRWIRSSDTARTSLSPPVRDAAVHCLEVRIPLDPPGYRRGTAYTRTKDFNTAEGLLATQVHEQVLSPTQPALDFALATHTTRPLYTRQSDIWVVTRRGTPPALPVTGFPVTTCSTREMETILRRAGYERGKGGKGSHVKMEKPGSKPVILPGNRKTLSPGAAREALRAVGHNLNDLPDLLRDREGTP